MIWIFLDTFNIKTYQRRHQSRYTNLPVTIVWVFFTPTGCSWAFLVSHYYFVIPVIVQFWRNKSLKMLNMGWDQTRSQRWHDSSRLEISDCKIKMALTLMLWLDVEDSVDSGMVKWWEILNVKPKLLFLEISRKHLDELRYECIIC